MTKSPRLIDRQQITNLVSNLRNGVECYEQRLTMESALRQQELALREKQALLDIKQKEFVCSLRFCILIFKLPYFSKSDLNILPGMDIFQIPNENLLNVRY